MSAAGGRLIGRVLVAECIHEVCSFNPVPTRFDDFFVNPSDQLLAYHRGGRLITL